VNNRYFPLKIVVLGAFLAACSSASEDKRYHDTSVLERPPILAVNKKTVEEKPAVDSKESLEEAMKKDEMALLEDIKTEEKSPVVDNSKIPKKRDHTGLDDAVYMVEQGADKKSTEDILATQTSILMIKQPYDVAWKTLTLALKQIDIEITDHEHAKGLFYVSYDPDPPLFSLKNSNNAVYVLTVKREGAETKVKAALGNAAEQSSVGNHGKSRTPVKDNSASHPASGAEDLLQLLYRTIRDDLEEE
jgi:uncharacterized lipoprotein